MVIVVPLLVCAALIACSELARYHAARLLGVPIDRVATYFVALRGGRRWARAVAIFAGTLTTYAGGVAVAFALFITDGMPTRYLECTVTEVPGGFPASGRLVVGDVITAIDGEPLDRSPSTLIDQRGGAPVRLTVRRGNTSQDITLRPIGHDGHWMLGFRPQLHHARSKDLVLALSRAAGYPFATIGELMPAAPEPEVDAAGPTAIALLLQPHQPSEAATALRLAMQLCAYLLLIMFAIDLVRAVRAITR